MNVESTEKPKFSIPSIIAMVAAIASFVSGAFWGLFLALVAMGFGIIGIVRSFSPRLRGGLMSTFALCAGLLGVIAAIIKAIAWIL